MEVVDQKTVQHVSRMDGWPECFQDLRSWCHPDPDELHTPQITMQDEFNFSIDDQVDNQNWGLVENTPVEINDSWINQDPLIASPNNLLLTEEENNNLKIQNIFSTTYSKEDSFNELAMQSKAFENTSVASNNYNVLKTKGNVLLSQVSILPEGAPYVLGTGGSYTDSIKLNSSTSARLGNGGRLVKQEQQRPSEFVIRPKLKLTIPPPETQQQVGCNDLTTPEVLKPLTDLTSSDFDLLNYVCGDSGNRIATVVVPKKEDGKIIIPDHDYVESSTSTKEDDQLYIKCEPLSPMSLEITSRINALNEAMDQDEEILDSFDEDDEDYEESEEWFPSSKTKKLKTRRRKASSIDSDGSGCTNDKYRTLRDRNNEASRRSRMNRKQRDTEMRRHKSDLERKNVELKVKADRMEALVKDMRAILLKAVQSRNQQPQALR